MCVLFSSVLNLTCREATIPSMTLIVGANLLKGSFLSWFNLDCSASNWQNKFQIFISVIFICPNHYIFYLLGLRRSEVGVLLVVGVIVVRYIILPLLGVVIVKAAHSWGMVGSSSLYQFILMLQYALPPAMSVGMMNFYGLNIFDSLPCPLHLWSCCQ